MTTFLVIPATDLDKNLRFKLLVVGYLKMDNLKLYIHFVKLHYY